jgi:serine protease Do
MLELYNMIEEDQIVKTIKKVLPAVVSITISKYLTVFENPFRPSPFGFEEFFAVPKGKKKVKVGGGSGFIVDKSGIILTNRHVVIDPQAEYVVVLNNKKKCQVKVLARDQINDIAIIKIEGKNLPVLELGNSSKLELGQTTIAIGNTLGNFENTVSTGVVSGLSRKIKAVDVVEQKTQSLKGLVQTDAAINPGNSGGPLVNIQGRVIGINAAMVFGAENVGFAIPVNAAKKDLADLKKYGKIRQPFLGLRYIPISEKLKKEFNLPVNYGALVVSEDIPEGKAVVPGGPAEKAGIKETDIILEIQNKRITIKNPLQDILQEFKVGDEIKLKVLRKNGEALFKAILTDKK